MIRRVGRLGRRRVMLLMVVLVGLAPGVAPGPASQAESKEQVRRAFKPYVDYLNEFTERRRVNVYFPNQQSIFGGARVGWVHVGWGNLTMVRRDLVTVGRLPLMIARVYDSRLGEGEDFGPGWRLSAAETIRVEPDGSLVLRTESAATIRLIPAGEGFRPWPPRPTDIRDVRQVDPAHFQVMERTGLIKEYTQMGDEYRLTRVEDRDGQAVMLEYADGKLAGMRGGNHRLIRIKRDAAGRIVSVTDDQGRRVGYGYNREGRLVEVTDLGGNGWRYEYDEAGRMTRAIDPLGHVNFAVVYDEAGRVRELEAPGQSYRYRYDPAAHRTRVVDGNGFESEYVQNEAGITVAIKNPLGVETRLELDEGNRVRRLYRNEALLAEMSYDRQGRLASLVTYNGDRPKPMSYVYDEGGRLVEIQSADGSLMLGYDDRGHLLERVDREGVTEYSYSRQGDLLEMSLADGRSFRFEVDADGQITLVEDRTKRRRQTRFKYDKTGRLIQTRFADGSTHSYRYTRLGLRRLREYDDGARVEYRYNVAGSLTEIEVTNRDGTVRGQLLTLDEDQRVRLVEREQGETTDLAYDKMGNPVAVTTGGQTTRFNYDGLNRLVEVITPEGKRLRYDYAEGEPDIRIQMDDHTRLNPSGRMTSGLTFSSGLELLRNRTERSAFGVVRFDRAMMEYRLASDYGLLLPDAVPTSAIARMRLMELGEAEEEEKNTFDSPSNVMFLPPEYWAVNCCPMCSPWVRMCCYCNPCGGGGGGGQQQGPQVTVSGPNKVPLRASGTSQGQNAIQLTASGTPSGGSYQWSTTSSRVSLSGTNTAQVTVTAVGASAMRDDVTVTVTYTVDGQSVSASKQLTVVKPSSLSVTSTSLNPMGQNCSSFGLNCNSYLQEVTYEIKDQFGDLFGPWTFFAREEFSNFSSNCTGVTSPPMPSATSIQGIGFVDRFTLCTTSCPQCNPQAGGCTARATQKWFVNEFPVRTNTVIWTCTDATIQ